MGLRGCPSTTPQSQPTLVRASSSFGMDPKLRPGSHVWAPNLVMTESSQPLDG
uniref:Uncharacterized protein n=1 Tax=Physcomitrium patens TaxID=3218 RepID=A0A2K1IYM9_PHYPA|nr:hypothetical protein PHYPA_024193 [Physcomitrium patens]